MIIITVTVCFPSVALCQFTNVATQIIPGPVQAGGPGLRHREGLGCVRVFQGQRHQPSGAGQHVRRALEGHQQKQRL